MKITEHCYVIYGLTTLPPWMVNAGFIVGSQKTLIVDCGYNYLSAQTIYGYALAARPQNKFIAVNTEPHTDHMGGNCFFREMGIDVYGHAGIHRSEEELAEVKAAYNASITNPFRREKHEEDVVFYKTRFENPNIPISENIEVNLGKKLIEIILTRGHTPMNISVYVSDEKVLFCGDIIVTGHIPHLGESTIEDWKEWLVSLDTIEKLSPKIVVPGHGEILQGEEIFFRIQEIRSIVKTAISTGKPPAP